MTIRTIAATVLFAVAFPFLICLASIMLLGWSVLAMVEAAAEEDDIV